MRTRAVFLDALGTLVELEPPWIHLAAELGEEPTTRFERAFRAEMSYYREHAIEARDQAALAKLRDAAPRCSPESSSGRSASRR